VLVAVAVLGACERRPPKPKTVDAEQARTKLLEAGVRADRITVSAEVSEDDIAAEAPGKISRASQPKTRSVHNTAMQSEAAPGS